MRCASYCTAERYDIDELSKHLRKEGMDPKFYDNVIHLQKNSPNSHEDENHDHEIFIFPYGCVSFWGLNEEEEIAFLQGVKDFEIASLDSHTFDTSVYDYGLETLINEENDEIILESQDELIKLSLSHGLTQSVKMEVFERSVLNTIEKTSHIPYELAHSGKILMSRKKLSQKIGALFAERNSINLHCDLLDTPEFFWRRPRYETYYILAAEYMDIRQRLEILDKRLNVVHELYDILSNELKHAHSSRLEWIIILLIVIEVLMTLLKDVFHIL